MYFYSIQRKVEVKILMQYIWRCVCSREDFCVIGVVTLCLIGRCWIVLRVLALITGFNSDSYASSRCSTVLLIWGWENIKSSMCPRRVLEYSPCAIHCVRLRVRNRERLRVRNWMWSCTNDLRRWSIGSENCNAMRRQSECYHTFISCVSLKRHAF